MSLTASVAATGLSASISSPSLPRIRWFSRREHTRSSVRLAAVVGAVLIASGAAAARPAATVQLRVYAATGIRLTDVVWTGSQFLYVENTTNTVYSAGPKGTPLHRFAAMPKVVEETRCRIAPEGLGF